MMQTTTFTLDEQIQHAVVRHPHLKQRQVEFNSIRGCVTIRGSVKTFYEKQMAQEALRKIDGVTSIENQLEVSWR